MKQRSVIMIEFDWDDSEATSQHELFRQVDEELTPWITDHINPDLNPMAYVAVNHVAARVLEVITKAGRGYPE